MLSTDLSTGWVLFSVAIVAQYVLLYVFFARVRTYLVDERAYIAKLEQDLAELAGREVTNVTMERFVHVETSLTELLDSYQALLTSHKKLRSRIGMREHRVNGKADDLPAAAPADESGRAQYKHALRDKAKRNGWLK